MDNFKVVSICDILLLALLVAMIAFFAGVDHQMDKQDEATRQDRFRIYCSTPGHSENICEGKNLVK